ncbi:MAG: hypothetical protein PVJ67_02440 [Candidatus Pacearchaeota archaeon]|jgi:hypothetical protein
MSLEEFAVTLEEFDKAINIFIKEKCEKHCDHLVHKNCGGDIRVGFLNLFYLNENGTLDPGEDGFGIGPRRVPYCERCFPPDGFKHTYAYRFPILRERKNNYNCEFTWGNKEITQGNKKILLE